MSPAMKAIANASVTPTRISIDRGLIWIFKERRCDFEPWITPRGTVVADARVLRDRCDARAAPSIIARKYGFISFSRFQMLEFGGIAVSPAISERAITQRPWPLQPCRHNSPRTASGLSHSSQRVLIFRCCYTGLESRHPDTDTTLLVDSASWPILISKSDFNLRYTVREPGQYSGQLSLD